MSEPVNYRQQAEQALADAVLLYPAEAVEAALDRMAKAITDALADKNPVVLCLMIGAVVPVGRLLPRLNFPLQVDYVHVTRYRGETKGSAIHWLKAPGPALKGRHVLLVDDILDEGITLSAIIEECRRIGVASIHTAVLVDKQIGLERPLPRADFTGLTVPDRYVFGYGMDYKEYLRNCPGIYAVKDQ